MATGQGETVAAMPGVDYVVDNEHKAGIPALVDAHRAGEISAAADRPTGPFAYGSGEHAARARRFLRSRTAATTAAASASSRSCAVAR